MTKLPLLFLLLLSLSNGSRRTMELSQKKEIPKSWKFHSIPSSEDILKKVTFVLKISNEDKLEKLFWSISNPDSPSYAQYLDLPTILREFSTPEKSFQLLKKWLFTFSLTPAEISLSRDFVTLDIPVKVAEEMFQVKFMNFVHPEFGVVTRTLDSYSLPSKIAEIVSFVSGMHRFPSKGSISAISTKRNLQQDSVTPQIIWSTFATNGTKGKSPSNIQAVAQFLQQYYDPTDLSDFQSNFNLDSQPIAKIIGPNDVTNAGTEALLDVEYITATAPGIPTWFWSTGGLYNNQEPFVQWAQDMNSAATIPFVISVSYGDEESSVSKDYTDRLNAELQKLALRGVSVLFSSGDNGVGCTSKCVNDPNWPASSPYVTSVGGFANPSSLTGDSISSGGFSNYYSIPDYQASAVQNYLTNGPSIPPASQYNSSGRAMPDVSSFSENVVIYVDGFEQLVGGTSCASPVFGGIVSLINDALFQKSLKPLGFLNTALYKIAASTPAAFIDITTGNNANDCCQGFTATTGWDPITGLGGPNFPVLLQAFIAFQQKE